MMKFILVVAILFSIAYAREGESISSCREFERKLNGNPFGTFYLKNDIDCTGFTQTIVPNFRGTLYGRGHTIHSVRIECNYDYYCGIIGQGNGARVEDIKLENIQVKGGVNMGIGALFGALAWSSLDNVHLGGCKNDYNEVSNGGYIAGGLVGLSENVQLTNVFVRNTLVAGAIAGGVVGSIGTRQSAEKRDLGKRAGSASFVRNVYNYGFESDPERLIVKATPSGVVTTVLGYVDQVQQLTQLLNALKSDDKAQQKTITPPTNFVGETWAGGVVGTSFGVSYSGVGTFRGLIVGSSNGFNTFYTDYIRFAAGGVIGYLGDHEDKNFCINANIPIIGCTPNTQTGYHVTVDEIFAERDVRVMAVDQVIAAGVIGIIGEKTDASTNTRKDITITNGYSKAEVSLSRSYGNFPSSVAGFFGYNYAGAHFGNVISSSHIVASNDATCISNFGCQYSSVPTTGTPFTNAYYDNSVNAGLTQKDADTNAQPESTSDILHTITTSFSNIWDVKHNHFYTFRFENDRCHGHNDDHHYGHHNSDDDDRKKK